MTELTAALNGAKTPRFHVKIEAEISVARAEASTADAAAAFARHMRSGEAFSCVVRSGSGARAASEAVTVAACDPTTPVEGSQMRQVLMGFLTVMQRGGVQVPPATARLLDSLCQETTALLARKPPILVVPG